MEPSPPQQSPQSTDALIGPAAKVSSLEGLAELLRALRRRHARIRRDNELTYRELARVTGWSRAAIAEYFTARTLPPTDRFDALLKVLGATAAEQRALADARDRVEESRRQTRKHSGSDRPGRGPGRTVTTARQQLPADTSLFTGRDDELAQLFRLARRCSVGGVPGAAVISAVDGMGGVGKTAIVLHAAHHLAEYFPDGQMFVELHGFSQDQPPRSPADALAGLLGALGVPPGQLPADTDSRAALYRERMAGTRTLVVLDNAADEAQVRPLLPAAAGCLVLITSRRRLKTLDDAVPVPLDVLRPQEAITLLRQAARRDSEPSANRAQWERIAALCGYLPLALVIAGAVLRTGGKAWDLPRLIARLEPRRAGEELAGYTDEVRSLGAVFDLSYQHLSDDERLLFRRVGLLPGRVIDAYSAAALLDTDPGAADLLVQRLADHSLLVGDAPGRYHVHDLIHAHAAGLAVRLDPAAEREAARDRLLNYYARTAQAASALVARYPRPAPADPEPDHAPSLANADEAWAWLRTERQNLEAGFTFASARGLDTHTIALAAGLAEMLRTDGPWVDAQEIHQAAAQAAESAGGYDAHAAALTDLGHVRYLAGDAAGAVEAYSLALKLHRSFDRPDGEAEATRGLGRALRLTGDHHGAIDALTRTLELHRRLGNRLGEADALIELGRVRYLTCDFPDAADAAARALEIHRELGHRLGEAEALAVLGNVRTATGDYPGAVDAHARALESHRALGNRLGEAYALTHLGRAHCETGDYAVAGEALSQALEIHRELGHRNGEAYALTYLGQVRFLSRDYAAAADIHARALATYRVIGERGNEAVSLNHYAAALAATGQRAQALALYEQALAMNRELDKPDDEAISLEGIAEHHLAEGDTADAARGVAHLHQALSIYQNRGMSADADRVRTRLQRLHDRARTFSSAETE